MPSTTPQDAPAADAAAAGLPGEEALAPRPEPSPLRRRAVTLLQVALVVVALVLTWRLVSGIRWGDLAARLETASPPFLALALAFLVGRYAVWDARFRLAARQALGRSPRAFLGFFVLLASAALNLITPSARLLGGLLRARYFARSTARSFGLLYGVVLYDQMAHHAVMTLCTWLALIPAAYVLGHAGLALAAAVALVVVLVGLAVWSRRGSTGENRLVALLARRAARQEGGLGRLYAHGHEAVDTFVRLLGSVRLRFQALGLGAFLFLLNALAQWLVFVSIGERVEILPIVAVVALGNAAGMLTGTPGGLGTTEAAMVAGFVALGMDRVDAGAGTLLFRGLHYAVVLAGGLPALAVLEVNAARRAVRGETSEQEPGRP